MESITYVRKPLKVEATLITEENIEEIAKDIGKLRHDEEGKPYIAVDKRIIPVVFRVKPGHWLTTVGDNVRCYHPATFEREFVIGAPEVLVWVDYLNKKPEEPAQEEAATV